MANLRLAIAAASGFAAVVILLGALNATNLNFWQGDLGSMNLRIRGNERSHGDLLAQPAPENTCAIVYGTRPELIKVIPVIRAFRQNTAVCNLVVVSSGQHKEMLKPLEEYFSLIPDIDLQLMSSGGTLSSLASRSLQKFTALFGSMKPHIVIVQGDTTTALAAGVAAFHLDIHVMHIEAGLRTGDLSSPYPEEFNRQTLGLLCTLCFAPTALAAAALSREAIAASRIVLTGNTVVDSLFHSLNHPPMAVVDTGGVKVSILDGPNGRAAELVLSSNTKQLLSNGQHVVLLTAHRRENARDGAFEELGAAISRLARKHPDVQWVFALHYNPLVRDTVIPILKHERNVWLISPPAYPEFVQLLRRVTLIVSDSGGLQEEGLALGLPTLITRTNTERMEGVIAGGALLVGNRGSVIEHHVHELLTNSTAYRSMASASNPYGDGDASTKILTSIQQWYKVRSKSKSAAAALRRDVRPAAAANTRTQAAHKPEGTSPATTAPPVPNAFSQPTATPQIKFQANPKYPFRYRQNEVTVMLTGYNRPAALLEAQLQALQSSTLKPAEIVLFQNGNFTDFTKVLAKWTKVKHIHSRNWNTKFHGRFVSALLFDTEFVAIADDTNVPGPKWLEAAVRAANDTNGIIGNSGRNIVVDRLLRNPSLSYQSGRDTQVGKSNKPKTVQVDFVGHWWVTRTKHLGTMWRLPAATLWTAEDIHLSAAASVFSGVNSYVLDVPNSEYTPERGVEHLLKHDAPSYKVPGTDEERVYAAQYWIQHGWQPLSMAKYIGK